MATIVLVLVSTVLVVFGADEFCTGPEDSYTCNTPPGGGKQGHCVVHYASGDVYEGNFVDDNKQGTGTCVFSDGRGSVMRRLGNALRCVKCFVTRENVMVSRYRGLKYVGEWRQDRIYGTGRFYFKNGDVYTGTFSDGDVNGYGVLRYASGDRYEGEWMSGHRHGRGIHYYANGNRYDGYWDMDKRESGGG